MKNRPTFLLLLLIWLVCPAMLFAQHNAKRYMRMGNTAFQSKKYAEAEVNYRKSLELDPGSSRARYNLGNALLFQQKPKEAMKEYEKTVPLEKNPFFKAQIYHNMGVILQSQKQYGPAIECYKESLRNNPLDDQTRYNLALCQYLLKKNKGKGNNQNKKQKQQQKKDKQKDNSNKNQQQQKKQQQQQQNQSNNQMSKENADQLLKAAMMEENKTQEKVRKMMVHPRKKNVEKNW